MTNATDLLTQDHRKVQDLFNQYQAGDKTVAPEICDQLDLHSTVEESHLYPALAEFDAQAEGHALAEHAQVKDTIQAIREAATPEAAQPHMTELIEAVTTHVAEEENTVFPEMRERLGDERLERIGQAIADTKAQVGR